MNQRRLGRGLVVADSGRCAVPGAEGTTCGEGQGGTCQTGLRCVPAYPPPRRCRIRGAEGTVSGGAVGHPCNEGLACVLGADEDGVCRRPKGPCGANKRCGAEEVCCHWSRGECVAKDADVDCEK